jgi:hypothetical protein
MFFLIVDCETNVIIDVLPYIGQQTDDDANYVENFGWGAAVVLKLTKPYHGKGRTILCDNYFNSPAVALKLLILTTFILAALRSN